MVFRLITPPLTSRLRRAASHTFMNSLTDKNKFYGRSFRLPIMLALIALSLSSCTGMQTTTNTDRTTWEQLLLSQSLERTLDSARIPLDPGASVSVKTAGLTDDKDFAQELVVGWLREKGLQVQSEDGTYLIRVILHAFGTEQSESFVGLPAIESTIIPIALPELSLYKATKQRGYSRLQLEISDTKSGALIASSPIYEDDVYFNQYIFLLAFGRTSTDISPPPL
ncbi:MAG: hypothetical protein NPIRA01_29890 [Nitrospirales bacterium]|nr:MAG: hypothetical protein NPIRA01_29890 [Nitrospirales bacterium]